MTIEGTVNKTGIALVILLAAATWTWNSGFGDPRTGGLLMLGGGGWAPLTTPVYAACESLVLGGSRPQPSRDTQGSRVRRSF